VVNSVLIGGTLGLAVQAGTGTLAASAPVGVITGAALAGHFARQRAIWRAARQSALGSALFLYASQRQTGRWRTVQAEKSTATVSSAYGEVPVMGTGPGRRPRPWQATR